MQTNPHIAAETVVSLEKAGRRKQAREFLSNLDPHLFDKVSMILREYGDNL